LFNSLALLASFCFVSSAFSHEEGSFPKKACDGNDTTVAIVLEEKRELTPDILLLSLRVNVTTAREIEAVNLIGILDEAIRKLNLEYKGGKYSVRENCWWDKGERKCAGYKGSIAYTFFLKSYSEQNEVLEVVDKFKREHGEKVKFEISEPEWIVSEKRKKEVEKELTVLIFEKAKGFSKVASKELGKICDIESINYERESLRYYSDQFSTFVSAEASVVRAPQPEKEEKSISVRASVRLRCK